MVPSREREKYGSSREPGTQFPATTAARISAPPMSDASTTRPGRRRYMYSPTRSATGIVQAMVNVPQELPGTSWTEPAGRMYSVGSFEIVFGSTPGGIGLDLRSLSPRNQVG